MESVNYFVELFAFPCFKSIVHSAVRNLRARKHLGHYQWSASFDMQVKLTEKIKRNALQSF